MYICMYSYLDIVSTLVYCSILSIYICQYMCLLLFLCMLLLSLTYKNDTMITITIAIIVFFSQLTAICLCIAIMIRIEAVSERCLCAGDLLSHRPCWELLLFL